MELSKVHSWIMERAPMLANVYQNKYVQMLYDRFASLPPTQQKQVISGTGIGILVLATLTLGSSYWSLWSTTSRSHKNAEMISMLMKYQKQRREKAGQIQELERNKELAAPGQLKQYIVNSGRTASISPRMIQVDEQDDNVGSSPDPKSSSEIKVKRAATKIQRINLNQLTSLLQALEFGQYGLTISSIRIMNDDKLRGYMNVELGIIAYLFQVDEVG
ncbi:MAG: hypothetical protein HYR96_08940 [Deltaproteobacteria bacterium]|nr:hypothetical protein [Deltaproteobacteria bacterium]MBI3293832.1 hypothetical protein [Deltaproteobacteria bacterium]